MVRTGSAALTVATTALLALALPASARAEEVSPTRAEDQFFFGMYGGVALSSGAQVRHWSQDGSRAELDELQAPVSWAGGYSLAWWPLEYVGLEACIEAFGLPLAAEAARFEDCDDCATARIPRTPDYGGFGVQFGPSVRAGLPLRYLQPNVGVGLMLPVTLQLTQEPASRLDKTAVHPGASLRLIGAINGYLDRDWRLLAEYHFDYRLATIGDPQAMGGDVAMLENEELLTHMIVGGLSYSPTSFKESPDKSFYVAAPFILPLAGWAITSLIAGLQSTERDPP